MDGLRGRAKHGRKPTATPPRRSTFCEFYGREMLRWSRRAAGHAKSTGEDNRLEYIPLGVGAVIPPWNFPLAIMAGMTMAAVVAGNTVVLKPSSDSPTIAAKFIEILEEIGLPPGVVNFLTGSARTGEAMVTTSEDAIHFVYRIETGRAAHQRRCCKDARRARTGSSASSPKWAARTRSSSLTTRIWIRRQAASFQSAFGFQGQKCSACSRLDRRREGPRRADGKSGRTDEETEGRPADRRRHEHGGGDQQTCRSTRRSDYIKKGIERRRKDLAGRQRRRRERFLYRADDHRRCRARCDRSSRKRFSLRCWR